MAVIMERNTVLFVFLISIFSMILPGCVQPGAAPEQKAVKGFLTISSIDLEKRETFDLSGEWEFYWNRLLSPSDFSADQKPPMTSYFKLPDCWTASAGNGEEYSSTGCATYRLLINLGDPDALYGFIVPETLTANKLWINGKVVASTGVVSLNPAEMFPQYSRRVVYLRPDSEKLEIIWQVANSNYRKGGVWIPMSMGLSRNIAAVHDRRIGVEIFLAGCLLIMALYHIGLFIYRRKDRTPLYFGLFCLIIVLRILTTGELLLESVFPWFNWEIARKMEFTPFYVGGTFFMLFLYSVFPKDIKRNVIIALASVSGAMGLFVLAAPVRLGNYLVVPLEFVTLAGLLYLMVCICIAVFKKRHGAFYIFFGFLTIILASINDILFSNGLIDSVYLVPFGLLFLIFSQSLMLAMRFSDSFTRVEELSESLTDINASMKRFVPYEFLNYLGKQSIVEVMIGDQTQQEMTVFFSDIRSFTTTAEMMTPQEVINFLNSYLSLIAPVIRMHKGFIDKFIGDAVMALYPDGAESAIDSAISIQKLLRMYNSENEGAPGFPIKLGIGLHTGKLMLGTIGDRGRLDTTVISDAVNLSSRIESLTKLYGAEILVSEVLLTKMKHRNRYQIRYIDKVRVKGKTEPVTIFEVLDGLPEDIKLHKIDTREDFEHAVNYYQNGNITVAVNLFKKIAVVNPDDKAVALYLGRCSDRRKVDDISWDGIDALTTK
jgi:class 3 adenylate cyclase